MSKQEIEITSKFGEFYPRERPRQQTYSCCIYIRSNSNDQELYCTDEDLECREDYRRLIDRYYAATFALIAFAIIGCFLYIIVAYVVKRRLKLRARDKVAVKKNSLAEEKFGHEKNVDGFKDDESQAETTQANNFTTQDGLVNRIRELRDRKRSLVIG